MLSKCCLYQRREEVMKKVAILTFSNTTNYGAVLQAYALKNKLINLGYDAEVLNYNCQAVKEREKIHVFDKNIRVTIKNILLIYPKFIRKITFKKFVRRENLYTKKTYNDKNISSTNNEYDIYVVGSDQVWNLQLSGYDYHYFLNFVSENKTKVSYAASLGSDEIDFQEYSMVVKFLKKFNYLLLAKIVLLLLSSFLEEFVSVLHKHLVQFRCLRTIHLSIP